jgi:hypothetical protein
MRHDERSRRPLLQVVRDEVEGRLIGTKARSLSYALFVFFVPLLGMAGAQAMPDPKQMSGMPLPVPDVAVGTVSARVIRGALTNPMPGETVELLGAGDTRTAKTDEAGRATFSGLAPGTRVKTAVVVNGERIESQEFAVPGTGGIRVMLVATDADIEKRAAADRALAAGPAVDGAVVFGEQSRFVIEVGDDALNVFNMLQIVNTAKRPVNIGGPLVFELPKDATGAGMLEGSTPAAVAAGKTVTVNGPFAPGDTVVQFAYSIPLGSETIVIAQKLPAQMTQLSVIAQKIGNMQIASPQLSQKREMPADGQTFVVGQGGSVKAGDTVTLTLSGLPHRSSLPAMVTLVISGVILAAGAWGATRGRSPQQDKTRAQLQARRDKLFSELTQLEEQRRKGSVDDRVYATRREHLVTALEDLYAGLEREVA